MSTTTRRRRVTTVLVAVVAALVPALGQAAWASWGASADGSGKAVATSVPVGPVPSGSVAVDKVTLVWSAVSMASGGAVTGYGVTRWAASTGGTGVPVCTTSASSRTCTDTPGSGTAYYSVRATVGPWSGADSARTAVTVSGAPVVGAATIAGTSLAGYVRPGGAYAVYAQVTGATSVSVDLSALGGSATQAMSAGSWTVGGLTYGWSATGLAAGSALADGTATVRITAKGSTGLTATTATSVVVDGSVTTTVLATLPARVRNGQTISAAATDTGSGVATLQVVWCSGSTCTPAAGTNVIASATTGSLSTTWSSQPGDGTYRLAAIATDRIGNSRTSTVQTVVVDNTGPRLTAVSTTQGTGGTAGRLESGDQIRLTFDDTVLAGSVPATTTVTLARLGNQAVTLSMPGLLSGTASLGSNGYVGGTGAKTSTFAATVAVSGNVVVVTVGAASGDPAGTGSAASVNLTPAATILDLAGNPASSANLSLSSYLAF